MTLALPRSCLFSQQFSSHKLRLEQKRPAIKIRTTAKNTYRRSALLATVACTLILSSQSWAGAREQAKRLHDRIAGVPPSATVLDAMEADINGSSGGTAADAALKAMQHPSFYKVTVKNLATPWTNRSFDPFAALNDYSATVIGMVRDDRDFREILYANTLYSGAANHSDMAGIPAHSNSNNDHYAAMEQANVNLADPTLLVESTQTALMGTADTGTAGVMTSRAAAKAFFKDGTNRAMIRYTVLNHLCHDLEQLRDTTLPSDRIRQDITRSPGGDSRLFLNSCAGCHTGMDPLAQAFAYYDYQYPADNEDNGSMAYNPSTVNPKYHINAASFPMGYRTPDDQWINYWRQGPNAALIGWDNQLTGSGRGAASMGRELAHTEAFAQCQVKKVFQQVCLREAGENDRSAFENMVSSFKQSNYKLKQTYADTAVYCMGD